MCPQAIAVARDFGPHDATEGPNNQQTSFKFNFHQVLHNVSQETVYESLARDVVQGVADGINGTIMSYGQTGSGKTFTMIGDTSNYVHRGVAPRSLSHIFSEIGMRVETLFTVTCTYMEIYNERIFDLLEALDSGGTERAHEYTIAEDKGGKGVFVRGLTEVVVRSEQEALNLLFNGELGRTTAQHKLNRRSNRSHSVFTVFVQQRSRSGVSEKVISSKLSIVDLAGSERLKKTMEGGVDGAAPIDDTLKKESMHINQSLTYLEQCVVALSRKGGAGQHVPYRQTKLTNVLKDALGGNCNTLLCACIWGEAAHLEETVSTLRLASRMMRVQNESVAVAITDPVKMVKKQEQIIKELKQELLMHDALADRTGVLYDPYTPEQEAELRGKLERFLACGADEEDDALLGSFHSVRQMRETCKQFKALYAAQAAQAQRLLTAASSMAPTGGGLGGAGEGEGDLFATAGFGATGAGGGGEGATFVGKSEGGSGFGLGVADPMARPVSHEMGGRTTGWGGSGGSMGGSPTTRDAGRPTSRGLGGTEPRRGGGGGGGRGGGGGGGGGFGGSAAALADKDTAFLMYKSGAGKATTADIATAKARAKALKGRSKACAGAINESKALIDRLNGDVEEKKQARLQERKFSGLQGAGFGGLAGDEDVVDEEEFRLMKKLRDAKRQYKAAYEDYAAMKQELDEATKEAESLTRTLLSGFDEWRDAALAASAPRDLFGDSGGAEEEPEELDDAEMFERMELDRVAAGQPDSLAFFQAQKTRRATATQNATALKQLHKNKRNR